MNPIADLLDVSNVLINIKAESPADVIVTLLRHLGRTASLDNHDDVVTELLKREKQYSYVYPVGTAIPHLATRHTSTDLLAVARLQSAIQWDTRTVQLVFLYLQPWKSRHDLRVKSTLYGILSDRTVLEELSHCTDASQLHSLILRIGLDLDVPDGLAQVAKHDIHGGPILAMAFSPSTRYLATSAIDGTSSIPVYALGDQNQLELAHRLEGHAERVVSLQWHPNKCTLASASNDRTVRLWDFGADGSSDPTQAESIKLQIEPQMVSWNLDGSKIAVAAHQFGARIWSTDSLVEDRALNFDNVLAVAWAPHRHWLAISHGRLGTKLCIWDVEESRAVAELETAFGPTATLAWAGPDGEFLAAGAIEGPIDIFDTRSWQANRLVTPGAQSVLSLCFTPDGKYLASKSRAGHLGTVTLRRTSTWLEVATFKEPCPAQDLNADIAFIDQETLVTDGASGGTVRFWHLIDDRLESIERRAAVVSSTRPTLPNGLVQSVAAGRAILFAGAGCSISTLDVTTDDLVSAIAKRIAADIPGYDPKSRRPEDVFDEFAALVDLQTLQRELVSLVPNVQLESPTHWLAVQLFDRIITTNWDELFERALNDSGKRFTQVVDADDEWQTEDRSSLLVKMHGTLGRPATIVATASQFASYYITHKRLIERLGHELVNARPVFVGYGLRDEHVRHLLAVIAQSESKRQMRGYAVGFFDEARRRLLMRDGIETVEIDAEVFMQTLQWAVGERRS